MGPLVGGTPRSGRARRSQSEVVGVVLILGIVVAGSLAIVALGATAIGDTESQLSAERAEKTLTQLDSKAGLVALREADSQEVALPSGSGESFAVDGTEGTLTIDITNRTTDNRVDWLSDPLVEVPLGALVFENEETKMAYQGGGVFEVSGANGSMLSPPEFHYRNGTLTLPVVNVTGEGSLGPTATVSQATESRAFPVPTSVNRTNPLDNHLVTLTVESEYYEGWGQYFEQRTDGDVEYDHDAEEVTLTLVTPIGDRTYRNAVTTTAGDFDIQGQGNPTDPTIDAYNSTVGPYSVPQSTDMSVAGDVSLGGNAYLKGNVTAESFSCTGTGDVSGTVYYLDSFSAGGACSVGDDESVSSIPDFPLMGSYVSDTVETLKSEPAPTNELTAGEYYGTNVDGIDEVNTTDGDVILGAETLEIDQPIEVEGKNDFKIFVNDTVTVNDDLVTEGPKQNATITTIYGTDDFDATINAKFVGTVFAPSSTSEVTVDDEVFGAVVAGLVTISNGNGNQVHFDKALRKEQAVPEDTSVVKITYLHITVNEIRVD